LGAATLLGGYSQKGNSSTGAAVATAAKVWAVAVPVALVIRSISRGYVPDKSFVIVSFAATAVLLVGWRAAFAAVANKGNQQSLQRNKRGNPLEFLQLLASLTKRW
jgi:hypothetical protein